MFNSLQHSRYPTGSLSNPETSAHAASARNRSGQPLIHRNGNFPGSRDPGAVGSFNIPGFNCHWMKGRD